MNTEAHGERWSFLRQDTPVKNCGFLGLGLSFAQLLSLASWIIGQVCAHLQAISCEICGLSSQPLEEMDPLNFIAGALDIWQAEGRAEH